MTGAEGRPRSLSRRRERVASKAHLGYQGQRFRVSDGALESFRVKGSPPGDGAEALGVRSCQDREATGEDKPELRGLPQGQGLLVTIGSGSPWGLESQAVRTQRGNARHDQPPILSRV